MTGHDVGVDAPAPASPAAPRAPERGSALEVLAAFTRLGLTSFGGPVAHLGYFREAFVERRRWLSEAAYAEIVALCQFLPGPASSQVGMAIGLRRAGLLGMAAAWLAFTLPSAALLVAFALAISSLGDVSGAGWILGTKAAAVAVVAQAVLGMGRSLAPDKERATVAALAAIVVLLLPGAGVQVAVIAVTGLIGLLWLRGSAAGDGDTGVLDEAAPGGRVPRVLAVGALAAFALLLIGLPMAAAATGNPWLASFAGFYRAGALVFGGGHVVLPLLEAQSVAPGGVTHDQFLAGYGAAQAVPGPLFTLAGFLGAIDPRTGSLAGAAVALIGIFLPGALLVIGVLPFWASVRRLTWARRALAGINAGVVGILGAALYLPVFTQGIGSPAALAVAIAAFIALTRWKAPPWAVVIAAGVIGQLAL